MTGYIRDDVSISVVILQNLDSLSHPLPAKVRNSCASDSGSEISQLTFEIITFSSTQRRPSLTLNALTTCSMTRFARLV
jgi:hypothetical protein